MKNLLLIILLCYSVSLMAKAVPDTTSQRNSNNDEILVLSSDLEIDTNIIKKNADTTIFLIIQKKYDTIVNNKNAYNKKFKDTLALENKEDTIKYWKIGGLARFGFNQISFTNWASGGESALSENSFANIYANYKKDKFIYENTVDMAYGIIHTRENKFQKNQDKIDISSKIDYFAYKNWHYSLLFNIKTQFYKGYKYPDDSTVVSRFFAPAYTTLSLGMDYKLNDYFSLFLSPASGKFTFVLDQELANSGAFGVRGAIYDTANNMIKKARKVKPEFGINIKTIYNKKIFENINLNSKLGLHNNYFDEDVSNRWNIDIDWEATLRFIINNHFSSIFYTHAIYDDDIRIPVYEYEKGKKVKIGNVGPKLQFKETFGIALSYKI